MTYSTADLWMELGCSLSISSLSLKPGSLVCRTQQREFNEAGGLFEVSNYSSSCPPHITPLTPLKHTIMLHSTHPIDWDPLNACRHQRQSFLVPINKLLCFFFLAKRNHSYLINTTLSKMPTYIILFSATTRSPKCKTGSMWLFPCPLCSNGRQIQCLRTVRGPVIHAKQISCLCFLGSCVSPQSDSDTTKIWGL